MANVEAADKQAPDLRKFLQATVEEAVSAAAGLRIMLRSDASLLGKLYVWLNPDRFPAPDSVERAAEEAVLHRE